MCEIRRRNIKDNRQNILLANATIAAYNLNNISVLN